MASIWLTSTCCCSSIFFLFFYSSRASLRLPDEGMAVLFHLHGTFVCAPLLHCSVAHWGGRETGEDLAERDLSQENLLWIQGELQEQHKFFTSAEALVQETAEGSDQTCHFFRYLCNDGSVTRFWKTHFIVWSCLKCCSANQPNKNMFMSQNWYWCVKELNVS